jgi:hypothetical protein
MRAPVAVDAGFRQAQPFDWPPLEKMLLDNLLRITRMNLPVPHRIRVDDDNRAMLALIQTAGLVRPNLLFQARFLDGVLEGRFELLASLRQTAWPRSRAIPFVGTDKKMMFEKGHSLLDSFFWRRMHRHRSTNGVPASGFSETISLDAS